MGGGILLCLVSRCGQPCLQAAENTLLPCITAAVGEATMSVFACVKESLQTATACKKCLASLACWKWKMRSTRAPGTGWREDGEITLKHFIEGDRQEARSSALRDGPVHIV